MKSDSKTAQFAAAHRAYHYARVEPVILNDQFATRLLSPPLSTVLRYAPLRWLFWRPLYARVQPISTFVVVRSRYTEDLLGNAIKAGTHQYLILGAGLDSWALRGHEPEVTVFELDHPDTQAMKQATLQAQEIPQPPNLIFAPINFETENIVDVLANTSFDARAKVFVSWLGTICYLTGDAIAETFASLARVCAPGSRISFDYFLTKSAMLPEDLAFFELLDEGGSKRGEPIVSLHLPEEMSKILAAAGFKVLEDVSADEIHHRYLKDRKDDLSVPGFVRLCCAERLE